MDITILTLFPQMFAGPFDHSILKRATQKGAVTIRYVNIRDFAHSRYKSVDDRPYGGGVGMILRVDILDSAIEHAKTLSKATPRKTRIILLDPQGTVFTQAKAQTLRAFEHIILICGHYEGVDERIRTLVDEEISIGDFILTGGEIPAMCIVDSIVRLLPTVLKKKATDSESFSQKPVRLEYPQYTRPELHKGMKVPKMLLSGHHAHITKWKDIQSTKRTRNKRPDLMHD